MRGGAAALLLGLLAACDISGDCLPAAVSPQRQNFRDQLGQIVYVSQCPGAPTPAAMAERKGQYLARKRAFLARVAGSKLAADLDEARRKFEEWTRNVNEAECATYADDYGSRPEDLKEFAAWLAADEARLKAAEASFERLNASCIG